MKNNWYKWHLAVFFFLLTAFPFTYADCREFTFCTPNTPGQRIFKVSNVVLKEAFSRLGHTFKLVTNASIRCPVEVDYGKIDGDSHRIYNFNYDNRYPNLIRVEEAVQSVDQSVFTKNREIKPSWDSIKHYTTIYLKGIKVIELGLKNAEVPDQKVITVYSHENAFKLLAMGRGDLIIVNSDTGNDIIEELNLTDSGIQMLRPPLEMFDLYSYMNKKHEAVARELSAVLKEMKNDGSYERIVTTQHQ